MDRNLEVQAKETLSLLIFFLGGQGVYHSNRKGTRAQHLGNLRREALLELPPPLRADHKPPLPGWKFSSLTRPAFALFVFFFSFFLSFLPFVAEDGLELLILPPPAAERSYRLTDCLPHLAFVLGC